MRSDLAKDFLKDSVIDYGHFYEKHGPVFRNATASTSEYLAKNEPQLRRRIVEHVRFLFTRRMPS